MLLGRFADARLRAVLRRTLNANARTRDENKALRRRLAARDQEIGTLRTLLATWQGIARKAQDDLGQARTALAAQIAETQEVATELAAERTKENR